MNELVQLVKVIREKCEGKARNERDRQAGSGGVGWRFRYFRGTARDATQAYKWLNLATALLAGPEGDMAAQKRDLVAATLSSDELLQAQRLARKCLDTDYATCR